MMAFAIALMAAAASAPALPKDVGKFVAQSELCYHWAGEEPGDTPEREKEIEQGLAENCNDLSAMLAALRKRYCGNRNIETLLDRYDSDSGLLKSLSGEQQ